MKGCFRPIDKGSRLSDTGSGGRRKQPFRPTSKTGNEQRLKRFAGFQQLALV